MRSGLVHSAETRVDNRFLLATITMRAVRRLHIVYTRTEETMNRVLVDIANGSFLDLSAVEALPPPVIENLTCPLDPHKTEYDVLDLG